MNQIHNIASYKFVQLAELAELKQLFLEQCQSLALKGTVLLSAEGINLSLAGSYDAIASFKLFLASDPRFTEMTFRESISDSLPFKRMKVKLKEEIITMRCPEVKPNIQRAKSLSPAELKQWYDENRDMIVLDTRNEYEMQHGTFEKAVNLHLDDFSQFPERIDGLPKDKPIVMFCTGGVRCEKAAIFMENAGYDQVYQLDGGILNYFAEIGGIHYQGDCFVFDERIALNSELRPVNYSS